MSSFTVITENDESEWEDQTGVVYHFPKRYLTYLQPGTRVIYYKTAKGFPLRKRPNERESAVLRYRRNRSALA